MCPQHTIKEKKRKDPPHSFPIFHPQKKIQQEPEKKKPAIQRPTTTIQGSNQRKVVYVRGCKANALVDQETGGSFGYCDDGCSKDIETRRPFYEMFYEQEWFKTPCKSLFDFKPASSATKENPLIIDKILETDEDFLALFNSEDATNQQDAQEGDAAGANPHHDVQGDDGVLVGLDELNGRLDGE
jgi:hypothetical protein